MIVFLRRIPEDTQKHEIVDFLSPVLKGGLFQKTGVIEYIKFLTFKDTRTNFLEFHCLVTIDSEAAAERIIKKLNRKALKNKHIAVREYFHRTWHNDPRVNIHEWNEELPSKRKGDRRRARLEIVEKDAIKFSSNENFHRTF